MLSVKKRSNQNMISAIDQVKEKIETAKENYLPKNLTIELTNDQSSKVEHQVDELSNHIIFGIILVMIVLMFTMGLRNSLFVGAAIPLSMLDGVWYTFAWYYTKYYGSFWISNGAGNAC
jgi:multidrug efflux pump